MAKTPLAREIADLANALQSAKLHAIAERVAHVEHKAQALDAFMAEVSKDGGSEVPS
jgi:hypothetical protein